MALTYQGQPPDTPQYHGITGLPGDRYSMPYEGGVYKPSEKGWGWDPQTGEKTYNGMGTGQKADEAFLKSLGVTPTDLGAAALSYGLMGSLGKKPPQATPVDPMQKLSWQEVLKTWKAQQQSPTQASPTTTTAGF